MNRVTVETSSRLHLGLFGWGTDSTRRLGGLGLMIDEPGWKILATSSSELSAEGPMAARALGFAKSILERDSTLRPAHLQILSAVPEHVGLGTGTQLGLAVAGALTRLAGRGLLAVERLAYLSGRGLRSGIGLHGFEKGGLIVDGGRRSPDRIPPLIARYEFPAEWGIVLVIPTLSPGLSGAAEFTAFEKLPAIPSSVTAGIESRLIADLLPALVRKDLPAFGTALEAIQTDVGSRFAPVQGGIYANPTLGIIADQMRASGLQGVGQSSWGPCLYGFYDRGESRQIVSADRFQTLREIENCTIIHTKATSSNSKARVVL